MAVSATSGPTPGRGASGSVAIAGAIIATVLLGSVLVARRWHPIAHESTGAQGGSFFIWTLGILSITGLGFAMVHERDAVAKVIRFRRTAQPPSDPPDAASANLAAEQSPPDLDIPARKEGWRRVSAQTA